MTKETNEALKAFSEAVALAIARDANAKDVNWQDVIAKQEQLAKALDDEPDEDDEIADRLVREEDRIAGDLGEG